MTKQTTVVIALLLSLTLSHATLAQKLYKWVDKDGNICYQDTPPPDNGKVLRESELKRSEAAAVETPSTAQPVVVYTVENCDACEVLVLRLRQLEVPFTQQSLLNKDIQAEILAVSDSITAPTLKIGADFVNDFSDASLLSKLRQAGLNPVDKSAPEEPAEGNNPDPVGGPDQPPYSPS